MLCPDSGDGSNARSVPPKSLSSLTGNPNATNTGTKKSLGSGRSRKKRVLPKE